LRRGWRILPLTGGDIAAVIELAAVVWRGPYPGIVSAEQKL